MHESNLTTQTSRFLELADELIIWVCQHLSVDDLVSMAGTSHRLHNIALEILFARYKIDLMGSCISLNSASQSIDALPGLAISLSAINRRISYISCDLTRDGPLSAMISEICDLKRFLSRLSAVVAVSLKLLDPPAPLWERCVIDLLDTTMLKGCTTLTVVNNFPTLVNYGDPRVQPRVLAPHSWYLPRRLKRILFTTRVARKSSCSLRACQIQVLPRFIQPYLAQLLNDSAITELSFKHIHNSDEWSEFIRDVKMPRLTHLMIFQCSLPHAALTRFLTHHHTITHLDFQRNILPITFPALPAGLLPNLNTLRTKPEFLKQDLPPLASFPSLAVIYLPLGGRRHVVTRTNLSSALERISHCTNDITLILQVALRTDLEAWLTPVGADDVEASLTCVKTLELDTVVEGGLSPGALARLPRWLALFPSLDRVSVTAACLPSAVENGPSAETLVRDIKIRCPRLSAVGVVGRSEWYWDFPHGVPG